MIQVYIRRTWRTAWSTSASSPYGQTFTATCLNKCKSGWIWRGQGFTRVFPTPNLEDHDSCGLSRCWWMSVPEHHQQCIESLKKRTMRGAPSTKLYILCTVTLTMESWLCKCETHNNNSPVVIVFVCMQMVVKPQTPKNTNLLAQWD